MVKVTLQNFQNVNTTNVAIRCPHCGHNGTFLHVGLKDVAAKDSGNSVDRYIGIRRCPNENCQGHLFFVSNNSEKVLYTSPSKSIPFDKDNIPENVLNSLEEAINSHSNGCYIASAIMIRKTLEEICHDREAKGDNLKKRIEKLGENMVIPAELLQGMDDLRLLGNDAAHIEARTFNNVGKEEIEISIDFTKEILKAVYQYNNLLERLRSLKKTD